MFQYTDQQFEGQNLMFSYIFINKHFWCERGYPGPKIVSKRPQNTKIFHIGLLQSAAVFIPSLKKIEFFFQKIISQFLLPSKNIFIEDQAFDERLSYHSQDLSQHIYKPTMQLIYLCIQTACLALTSKCWSISCHIVLKVCSEKAQETKDSPYQLCDPDNLGSCNKYEDITTPQYYMT